MPVGQQFNPYTSNGGSILAIHGEDYCVIAGDTRQSEGYNIQTRRKPKVFRLTDKATLATDGFAADAEALVARVRQRLELYRYQHNSSMPLHSIARMLSTILYSKRFFPYYVHNILGGIDEQGRGAVFSYDPVGTVERLVCNAAGAAEGLLQPFLDNQVMFKNQQSTPTRQIPAPGHLSLQDTLKITMDSFTSATERHIEVGDGLDIFIVRNVRPQTDAASSSSSAMNVNLEEMGAVEAIGGEDSYTQKACMVIHRPLKRD
ncbi:proteasome endopeptidase complex [Malassezia yamatoensis]|uniref:Proteasome subunit beta n=1 Tax=Malassezia yamatoensis TaxID=253288 RepID=A0AAJ5YV31_9BASI|nr:proteasome endopeptidase complex [Malassezia yamatoensis]